MLWFPLAEEGGEEREEEEERRRGGEGRERGVNHSYTPAQVENSPVSTETLVSSPASSC